MYEFEYINNIYFYDLVNLKCIFQNYYYLNINYNNVH